MSSDEKPTFHLTTESLLTELLTLEQSAKTTSASLLAYQKAVANLAADIASGKVKYSEIGNDSDNLFRKANMKFAASKRTPEQRSAASQKGVETRRFRREEDQRRLDRASEVESEYERETLARNADGLLPKELSSYEGTPNPVYYTKAYSDPKSGIDHFELKPEYAHTPILKGLSDQEAKDILYPTRKSR